MQVLVGLGNPETGQLNHRHNVGFMCVDAIVAQHGSGGWRDKFSSHMTEIRLGPTKVIVLKPQTYMNLSGTSVYKACRFFKVTPQEVTVIHDDLDLEPGKIRCKRGGGHGGHNGLRDIDLKLGPDYRRLRVGIGHPGHKSRVNGWVLSPFTDPERDWLQTLTTTLADGAVDLADGQTPSRLMTRCCEATRAVIAG